MIRSLLGGFLLGVLLALVLAACAAMVIDARSGGVEEVRLTPVPAPAGEDPPDSP